MIVPTKTNTSTVTDMRTDAIGLLNQVSKTGFQYIFQRSDPKAVLMSMGMFQSLLERLEDEEDEMLAKEADTEPKGKGISLETVAKRYHVKIWG